MLKDKPLDGLKICHFGHFNRYYTRNRILQKSLLRAGAEIIEVNSRLTGLARYKELLREALRRHFDVLIVAFLSHTDMPVARFICSLKRIPLIFDAFISLYDVTYATDRSSSTKSDSKEDILDR